MALVIGIDPSTKKVAAVAIDTLTGTYKVEAGRLMKSNEKQTPASLGAALSFVRHFVEEVERMAPPEQRFAYVEPPMVGRGGAQTAIKLGYVGGVIRACLAEAGFVVYDASLSSWRGGFMGVKTGKGRSTAILKTETDAALKRIDPKLHTLVRHDGDLIDAAGIALYGAEQVRKAGLLLPAGPAGGPVQGRRPDVVVRPPRVRRPVRR